MKPRNVVTTLLVAAAMLSASSVAISDTTLRLSTYVNKIDVRYSGFEKFAELVQQKTNGQVTVQLFPSGTLHGWNQGIEAIKGGVADIAWIPGDGRIPCYRATSLYPTVVDLERQHQLNAEYTDLIKPTLKDAGLVPVLNSNYSYDQEWWFEEPIQNLTELDSKLVRTVYPLTSLMITTWGGEPVHVAPSEVFQAADRGVVDGINMGVATYSSWKLWDVMPYMVKASLFYGNIMYMMSENKWKELSPDNRDAILQAARETEKWLKPRYYEWVDARVGNAVMQGGGSAVSLPLERSIAIASDIAEDWASTVNEACGQELGDKIQELFSNYSR